MAKTIMTLTGANTSGLGADGERCKCVYNPRTKKYARLCFVGKGPKTRSGWQFQKGGSQLCRK
jgi:hypothetical protein